MTGDASNEHYEVQRPQTSAQTAVRWHGLAVLAVMTVSVPLFHVAWHVVAGDEAPPIRTRSQLRVPTFDARTFLDGSWLPRVERSLREASPVVWLLRGVWNELRYAVRAYQSGAVYASKDGWMFARGTLYPDQRVLDEGASARAQFLAEVRTRADELGVEVVVSLVPDKARVHPEHAYPDGALPPEKAGAYDRLLDEFAAAGLPTVDLRRAMLAARIADPGKELYYRRDTHWRPDGALVAAQAVTAVLTARLGARLGPRESFELGQAQHVRVLPDLVSSAGFLAMEIDVGVEYPLALPAGPVTATLMEEKVYYGVAQRTPEGLQAWSEEPRGDERVIMAGTSFAGENGERALVLVSGSRLHSVSSRGADGLHPLRAALKLVAADPGRFQVVVWEIVERGMFVDEWRRPRLGG